MRQKLNNNSTHTGAGIQDSTKHTKPKDPKSICHNADISTPEDFNCVLKREEGRSLEECGHVDPSTQGRYSSNKVLGRSESLGVTKCVSWYSLGVSIFKGG